MSLVNDPITPSKLGVGASHPRGSDPSNAVRLLPLHLIVVNYDRAITAIIDNNDLIILARSRF
jgi:hypothetical protein